MNTRQFLKRISSPFLKLISKYYLTNKRSYKYKNLDITVLPGVFHPGLFISTKQLLLLVDGLQLKSKQVLELGAGTGTVAIYCAKQGAIVTATDINPTAIENVNLNAEQNSVNVKTVISDLFDDIQQQAFDYIFINPPYYPKKPTNNEEHAWFCGEEFEYFKKLFSQIEKYINSDSNVFMILSEDCALDTIQEIANNNNINLELHKKAKVWLEWNYIFSLKK